ncbi:MAG: hypothetical protein CMI02_08150 [Oceanospirillaceae bacterium]|nr:hypothetical protein [Oceanospirillaceae bacterium]MBT11992.1 hypothetical protein [Oceanospirillaceae bacterium]|tara:strand:- start:92691 stop:93500 length:810 start_codon:yes stop_codon:yes gene_type:complete
MAGPENESDVGLGYRREMSGWDMQQVDAGFFEVVPENWINRNTEPLQQLVACGRPVHLHGVSLNLGGNSPLNGGFLRAVRALMAELGTDFYSDHLAASGDAHQLYDLFPLPFTRAEIQRVGDRIKQAQDILGCRMAIENPTWYSNTGEMPEPEFLSAVVDYADCNIVLDLNNIDVNFKNHGLTSLNQFLKIIDFSRVNYLHVAGHEYDGRFDLFVDTHSRPVENHVRKVARELNQKYDLPVLLEWDNDVPDIATINNELAALREAVCIA